MLAVLIAAAVALAPFGVAAAGMPGPGTKAPAGQTHDLHHDHGTMHAAATGSSAEHCKHKTAISSCCDDQDTCLQTCLQKCFGQVAVLPLDRVMRAALRSVTAPKPADRPPGWSSAPQLPPPRA